MRKTIALAAALTALSATAQLVQLPADNGRTVSFQDVVAAPGLTAHVACDRVDAGAGFHCVPAGIPNAFFVELSVWTPHGVVTGSGVVCITYGNLQYQFHGYAVGGVPWATWAAHRTPPEVDSAAGALFSKTVEAIARMRGTWDANTYARRQ